MTVKRLLHLLCIVALLRVTALPAIAATPPPAPDATVLDFLDHTIEWYRRVTAAAHGAVHPDEILFRDAVLSDADKTLHLAFDYAKAQAGWLATQASPAAAPAKGGSNDAANIAQAAANADQRVAQIQGQIVPRSANRSKRPRNRRICCRPSARCLSLNWIWPRRDNRSCRISSALAPVAARPPAC